MNILMIHPHDLFDKSEPWTIRIKSIAKELSRRSHSVRLCYFPVKIKNSTLYPKNIESVELIPLSRTPSVNIFISNMMRLISLSRWADVVHFQKCHHYAAIPAVIAAYVTKKPLHYDWDDWEEKIWYESCGRGLHSRFIGFSFRVLERVLPLFADSVSVSSKYLRDFSIKFGRRPEEVFPAPVGADPEKFTLGLNGQWVKERYNIKDLLVLYIGQLHGAQYVDLFIKATNIVLHKYPGVKFMIVGEGFLECRLRNMVSELGLNDKIIFTGAVPHDEIPYYIAAADICTASFSDTEVTRCKSPLKVVEYLISNKPIVASNVGEVRKMVGGAGVLVEPGSATALAEGINKLIGDKGLRDNLARFSRRRVETKYNWTYTTDSIFSAYEKILK